MMASRVCNMERKRGIWGSKLLLCTNKNKKLFDEMKLHYGNGGWKNIRMSCETYSKQRVSKQQLSSKITFANRKLYCFTVLLNLQCLHKECDATSTAAVLLAQVIVTRTVSLRGEL